MPSFKYLEKASSIFEFPNILDYVFKGNFGILHLLQYVTFFHLGMNI